MFQVTKLQKAPNLAISIYLQNFTGHEGKPAKTKRLLIVLTSLA